MINSRRTNVDTYRLQSQSGEIDPLRRAQRGRFLPEAACHWIGLDAGGSMSAQRVPCKLSV
jgi:hypothetical protein